MRRLESRSAAGALWLSWLIPGAGQFYLGEGQKGRLMMGAYFAVAIPTWLLIIVDGDLFPAALAIPPAMAIWIWNQRDIRRTVRLGWRPLLPTWKQTIDGIKGRDRAFPDDPLTTRPERPN
jgi:TM2 domain-containing membrane protein YozV